MKNVINYYYNLLIEDYKKKDSKYIFILNNIEYEFFLYNGDINRLMEIYTDLISRNLYCHEIILNKDNSMVTLYENKPYILLKKNINVKRQILFDDIFKYDIYLSKRSKVLWQQLWIEKVDYYEYQMNQIGVKYKLLKDSFNYYIGLCENAIGLLNYVDNDIKIYITHNRIYFDESINDFCNPVNIVEDNITRDISGYIKFGFISDNLNETEILNYLYRINLERNEYILLFARLLYPSYYFDVYDKIIQDIDSYSELRNVIKKSDSYETLLRKIYLFIKTRCEFPRIDWLESRQY